MNDRWRIETTDEFDKNFRKLDRAVQRRVATYLREIESLDDPRPRGKALTASHAGLWRYRVGDHRVLAEVQDHVLVVLALRVAHRRDAY